MICPEHHQDDAQQSSPPQHHLSLYIDWFVNLHSEPHIPETRENRTWANVDGQNGPRSRLQLHRNVTTTSTKWKMGNYWRHERSIWCKYWAMIWSLYWVRMHIPSQKIDICPRSPTQNLVKTPSSRLRWTELGNKPVHNSSQLLIFPSSRPIGAIDALLRRFRS